MDKIKAVLNALNIFKGLGDSRRTLKDNVKGWKTSCVYFSYVWFTFTIMLLIIASIIIVIIAGVKTDFRLHLDLFRDIILGIMKYVFGFFSIAIIAVFGVTYIDGKLQPKESTQTISENGATQ